MIWPFHNKALAGYWLKVFALYAAMEAIIQLLFLYILNRFAVTPISNLPFHGLMWAFQCLFIWPVWWVAHTAKSKSIAAQLTVHFLFFVLYSFFWFEAVQDLIRFLHTHLQRMTLPAQKRLPTPVDSAVNLHYQLLKHGFRLSWFYLADYFFRYRREEEQRLKLAVANKDLELRLLKWHLNPDFYFTTINFLRQLAAGNSSHCAGPILHLAKVMEYVIYEAREKWTGVEKEVQFLQSYFQLINQQPAYNVRLSLSTEGDFSRVKIPPLLLAGVIDKFLNGNKHPEQQKAFAVQLQFSGTTLLLGIKGEPVVNGKKIVNALVLQQEDLPAGVTLIPDTSRKKDRIKLRIQLYEEA